MKFLDFTREAEQLLSNGLSSKIESVIKSGVYLFGKKNKELEEKLSEFFNCPALLVGSGTDALTLCLLALKRYSIGCPAFTAIPTAAAIRAAGASPNYIDIQYDTANLDCLPQGVDGSSCSAMIGVHLYGQPLNSNIISACKNFSIPLIEDCAQAFGSSYPDGESVGTKGIFGAFSLYPSKNFGAYGDSGVVISKNHSLMEKIKELRFYGQKSSYVMGSDWGINSRVDEIQATILLEKLKLFDGQRKRRLELKKWYVSELKDCENVGLLNWSTGAVPHIFPIKVENRNEFMKKMKDINIPTSIHYPFTVAEIDNDFGNYGAAKEWSEREVSIPFNPWLTDKEVMAVLEGVKRCAE